MWSGPYQILHIQKNRMILNSNIKEKWDSPVPFPAWASCSQGTDLLKARMSRFVELKNSFAAFDHFRFDERHRSDDRRNGEANDHVQHGAESAELGDELDVAVTNEKQSSI